MRSASLKRLRILFAVVFLISVTSVFLDFRDMIPDRYNSSILFLQFVPSIIKFIDLPLLAASGFLLVLVLTFLTGRTYCSVICPLGIYQDVISRIGGRIRKEKPQVWLWQTFYDNQVRIAGHYTGNYPHRRYLSCKSPRSRIVFMDG
jgi:polyferredoxin